MSTTSSNMTKCLAFSIENLIKDDGRSRSAPAQVTGFYAGLGESYPAPGFNPFVPGFQACSTPGPVEQVPLSLSALSPVLAGAYLPVKNSKRNLTNEDQVANRKRLHHGSTSSSMISSPESSPSSSRDASPAERGVGHPHSKSTPSTPSNDSLSDEDEDNKRSKKARTSFTSEQIQSLETRFMVQRYLPANERSRFAELLKLSDQQVKTWFQNRRMKDKRRLREAELRLGHPITGPLPSAPVALVPSMTFPGHPASLGAAMFPGHPHTMPGSALQFPGPVGLYPHMQPQMPYGMPHPYPTPSQLQYHQPYAGSSYNGMTLYCPT